MIPSVALPPSFPPFASPQGLAPRSSLHTPHSSIITPHSSSSSSSFSLPAPLLLEALGESEWGERWGEGRKSNQYVEDPPSPSSLLLPEALAESEGEEGWGEGHKRNQPVDDPPSSLLLPVLEALGERKITQ